MLKNFTPITLRMTEETNTMLNYLVDGCALERIENEFSTIYIGNVREVMKSHLPKLYNYYTSLTEYDVMRMYVKEEKKTQLTKKATKAEIKACASIDEYYNIMPRRCS